MKLKRNKKGFGLLSNLPTVVLLFGIAVIITAIVAQITGQIQATQTANSYESNISISGLRGLAEIGSWYVTIGLIIGAIIVLSALFMLMQRR